MTRTHLSALLLFAALAVGCGGSMSNGAAKAPDPLAGVPAETLYERGMRYREAGDLIRAEQYLVSAIERGYPEKDALQALLDVCVSGSRFQAGLRHAQRYLARHPEDWALRYFTASLHVAVGDPVTARTELERVIGERPQLAEAHFALAVLYRDELRDPDAAEKSFRRYLELEPNGANAIAAESWLRWNDRAPVSVKAADAPQPTEAAPADAVPAEAAPPTRTEPH